MSLLSGGCFVDPPGSGPADGGHTSTSAGGADASGGGGGAATTTGASTSTTTTPSGMPCDEATDCVPPDKCLVATCPEGRCVYTPKDLGADEIDSSSSDCLKQACDGSGHTVTLGDTDDVPDDEDACTKDSCDGMTPVHEALDPFTICSSDPAPCSVCYNDACTEVGAGIDVAECALMICVGGSLESTDVDAFCADDDFKDCMVPVCMGGTCAKKPAPMGTPCGPTLMGSCKMNGTCMF